MSSISKKKQRIAIVTNKMPDDVYKHLDMKAKNSELTQYIIQLVQRDLANESVRLEFNSLASEIISLKNEYKKISKIYIYSGEAVEEAMGFVTNVDDSEINEEGIDDDISLDL